MLRLPKKTTAVFMLLAMLALQLHVVFHALGGHDPKHEKGAEHGECQLCAVALSHKVSAPLETQILAPVTRLFSFVLPLSVQPASQALRCRLALRGPPNQSPA